MGRVGGPFLAYTPPPPPPPPPRHAAKGAATTGAKQATRVAKGDPQAGTSKGKKTTPKAPSLYTYEKASGKPSIFSGAAASGSVAATKAKQASVDPAAQPKKQTRLRGPSDYESLLTVPSGSVDVPKNIPMNTYLSLDPSKKVNLQDGLGKVGVVQKALDRKMAEPKPGFTKAGRQFTKKVGETLRRTDENGKPMETPLERFDRQLEHSDESFKAAKQKLGEAGEALKKGDVDLYNEKVREAGLLADYGITERNKAQAWRERVGRYANESTEKMKGAFTDLVLFPLGAGAVGKVFEIGKDVYELRKIARTEERMAAFSTQVAGHSDDMEKVGQFYKEQFRKGELDEVVWTAEGQKHDIGGSYGKDQPWVEEVLSRPTKKGADAEVKSMSAAHAREHEHHIMWNLGENATPAQLREGASDIVNALREPRTYRKNQGMSFDEIKSVIDGDKKWTPKQKEALREALDTQKLLEEQGIIRQWHWPGDR